MVMSTAGGVRFGVIDTIAGDDMGASLARLRSLLLSFQSSSLASLDRTERDASSWSNAEASGA
jgi:hypothetical protein